MVEHYTDLQRLILYLCLVMNTVLFFEALIFYVYTWAQIREAEAEREDEFAKFEAIMTANNVNIGLK